MTSIGRSAFPLFASLLLSSAAFAVDLQDGAVYVMTNQPTNEIVIFDRLGNGTLERVGQVRTGGRGDPFSQGTAPATDPLASQGSLALGLGGRFLFAVNAGSNEISVFGIGSTGLTLVDRVPSGGTRPISLTTRGELLYVLNEGGTPGVTAFTIDGDGDLTRLAQSTRSLSRGDFGDPAQVSFTPDGERLVITAKRTNLIGTLRVRPDGRTGTLIVTPSSGLTPFGFGFCPRSFDRIGGRRGRARRVIGVVLCDFRWGPGSHQRRRAGLRDGRLLARSHWQRALRVHLQHRKRPGIELPGQG